ncbi:hypothetical protein M419DRAFT_123889 [Trichoderma reesei RUT C-30]|uniref:Uncharacterized protein n=1 Tax=Hypocrea jecorina (strain ATCC 56765 / BCRC 32924 / NRRL 11460 / Rut C-30) TaxID=1344414 RepID=A0A024S5N3_HYPJR|nr:hypothetical protein M419DRAFT_123889 [Trichoderma reesei RUT C-30]
MQARSRRGVEKVHHARLKSSARPTISLFRVVLFFLVFALVLFSGCVQGVVYFLPCVSTSYKDGQIEEKRRRRKTTQVPRVNRQL